MKCATATAILSVLTFSLLNGTHSQVVAAGPDGKSGPPPSSPDYCSQIEPIRPNLKLRDDTTVRGHVTDQTTAPLQHSPAELRRFISQTKQVTVKKISTDGDGNFDLGLVKRGDYRLLLSPHRGFKQPAKLECWSGHCTLDVVLIVNPTDALGAGCPIR
jgi:hypothetical protein